MFKYLSLIFTILLFSISVADDYRNVMEKGESTYKNDNFAEAIEFYNQAEVLKPDDPMAAYNSGASLYRNGDYDKAAKKFSQTVGMTEGEFKGEAFYNQGNSLFETEDYQGAMEAYRNSMLIDPSSKDAKFNYELAQRKLQEQPQQQQQQQNQDQNQDQDQQDKQDQEQQQQDQNQDKQQQQKQDQQKQQAQKRRDDRTGGERPSGSFQGR